MRTAMSSCALLTTMARWVRLVRLVTAVSCTVNMAVVVLASSAVNVVCVWEQEYKSNRRDTETSFFYVDPTRIHAKNPGDRYRFYLSREISKDTPSLSCFLSFSPSILPQLLPQCHWDVTLCCGGVSVLTSNTPFMANPDHHSCLGTVQERISSQKKVLFELWYSGSERIKSGEDGWYTPYLEEKN